MNRLKAEDRANLQLEGEGVDFFPHSLEEAVTQTCIQRTFRSRCSDYELAGAFTRGNLLTRTHLGNEIAAVLVAADFARG
jgi:hypothetical protein